MKAELPSGVLEAPESVEEEARRAFVDGRSYVVAESIARSLERAGVDVAAAFFGCSSSMPNTVRTVLATPSKNPSMNDTASAPPSRAASRTLVATGAAPPGRGIASACCPSNVRRGSRSRNPQPSPWRRGCGPRRHPCRARPANTRCCSSVVHTRGEGGVDRGVWAWRLRGERWAPALFGGIRLLYATICKVVKRGLHLLQNQAWVPAATPVPATKCLLYSRADLLAASSVAATGPAT